MLKERFVWMKEVLDKQTIVGDQDYSVSTKNSSMF